MSDINENHVMEMMNAIDEVQSFGNSEETIEAEVIEDTDTEEQATDVALEAQDIQNDLDNIEEPVEPRQVTCLFDGASYESFTTSARTVGELVSERGYQPEGVIVELGSGGFISDYSTEIDPDDVYHVIARNKTGG